MPDKISPKALEILKKIANDYGNVTSRKETREILRSDSLDTFQDNVIDEKDDVALLRDVLYSDLGTMRKDEKAKFQMIRERLKQELDQNPRLIDPPDTLSNDKFDVRNASLIRDPYVLMKDEAESPENAEWSRMRLAAKGQEIRLKTSDSLSMAQAALKGKEGASLEERAKILTKSFWENDDGSGKHVFRMDELHGVMEYMNTLPPDQKGDFFKAFQKNMADYVSDSKNGLDQQFVMDSLVALLQSTDWTGGDAKTNQMKNFVQDLAIGIAKNSDLFKNKAIEDKTKDGVVIGNYDGSLYDGNNFGSLALVRDKDGNFHFVQHETANPVNKTKYIFDDEAVSKEKPRDAKAGGGFGPPIKPGDGADRKAEVRPDAADGPAEADDKGDAASEKKNKATAKILKAKNKLDRSVVKKDFTVEAEHEAGLKSAIDKLDKALDADSLESEADKILEAARALEKIEKESTELSDEYKEMIRGLVKDLKDAAKDLGATEKLKPPAADAKPPAADAKPPAADAKPPAADAKLPAADAKPPAADAKPPAADAKLPAADAKPPAADAKPPAADAKPPAADAKPPAADAKPPAADAKPPAADPKPPAIPTDLPPIEPVEETKTTASIGSIGGFDETNISDLLSLLDQIQSQIADKSIDSDALGQYRDKLMDILKLLTAKSDELGDSGGEKETAQRSQIIDQLSDIISKTVNPDETLKNLDGLKKSTLNLEGRIKLDLTDTGNGFVSDYYMPDDSPTGRFFFNGNDGTFVFNTGTTTNGDYENLFIWNNGERIETSKVDIQVAPTATEGEEVVQQLDLYPKANGKWGRTGFDGDYTVFKLNDDTYGVYYAGGPHINASGETDANPPGQKFHHGHWDQSAEAKIPPDESTLVTPKELGYEVPAPAEEPTPAEKLVPDPMDLPPDEPTPTPVPRRSPPPSTRRTVPSELPPGDEPTPAGPPGSYRPPEGAEPAPGSRRLPPRNSDVTPDRLPPGPGRSQTSRTSELASKKIRVERAGEKLNRLTPGGPIPVLITRKNDAFETFHYGYDPSTRVGPPRYYAFGDRDDKEYPYKLEIGGNGNMYLVPDPDFDPPSNRWLETK